MVLYMGLAMLNLYRLMYPLSSLDLSIFPPASFISPLWESPSKLYLQVYLSSQPQFRREFMHPEDTDGVLLWNANLEGSLSKSFLLCTQDCDEDTASYKKAVEWLDEAESKVGGDIMSELKAGEGIESTSFLLVAYEGISNQVTNLLTLMGLAGAEEEKDAREEDVEERSIINLPSGMFARLHSNATLFVHVLITRTSLNEEDPVLALNKAARSNSLLLDKVDLVKYDVPNHIDQPKRILLDDVLYVLGLSSQTTAPWDLEMSQPEAYATFQMAEGMKKSKAGYPYWKPEVSVKYIYDGTKYPSDYAGMSGMQMVQTEGKSQAHPTGIAMLPSLHVDEIGLTSEKYLPVNTTLTAVPLRINVDRSDVEDTKHQTTATAGGMSPARWRLLSHLSDALESQKQLGFEQSDIDDLRRLIADTNIMLLAITILASALHLLFEFLTFKNEVTFWRDNKDLTGLSVRSLFLDMMGQVIILLFLIEKDSSLLMTIPTACGCLIALWKCQRGAGFVLKKVDPKEKRAAIEWWNRGFRLVGYELRATRLEVTASKPAAKAEGDDTPVALTKSEMRALTIETDRIATRTLGSILLPLVLGYTLYSFLFEEHAGWYSWLITSASSAVYALGFVLMTPQLFLNYKLKSVAHLPWRVLVYKFLNTFIDDLFAFIIRMPTMARLSCFRDDIVFIIYLYQRWLYPVDTSRPVEGGGEGTTATSEKEDKKKKTE
jgi:hypothetical protein